MQLLFVFYSCGLVCGLEPLSLIFRGKFLSSFHNNQLKELLADAAAVTLGWSVVSGISVSLTVQTGNQALTEFTVS